MRGESGPPSSWGTHFSRARLGLWSSVNRTAVAPRASTALESPTWAVHSTWPAHASMSQAIKAGGPQVPCGLRDC